MRAVLRRVGCLVIVVVVVGLQSGLPRREPAASRWASGHPSRRRGCLGHLAARQFGWVLVVNGDEPTDDDRLSLKEPWTSGLVIDAPADLGDLSGGRRPMAAPRYGAGLRGRPDP